MPRQKITQANTESLQVAEHTPQTNSYLEDNGYGHVIGHISDSDVEAFRSIVARMPQHFTMVELGSLYGASAITFTLLAYEMGKTCDILCIDLLLTDADALRIFTANTTDFSNISYRAEWFNSRFEYNGTPIDLYFDDASHDEIPTYKQLVFWSQYAKNIAVHDYITGWEGNIAAVNKFVVERGLNLEKFNDSSVVFMENI